MIDCIGDFDADPGDGWDVCGVAAATKDHTLVRKSSVSLGNMGVWATSAGTSIDDGEWEVMEKDDWSGVGVHNASPGDEAALFFSEYAEGSSNNKYLEIYNAGTVEARCVQCAICLSAVPA